MNSERFEKWAAVKLGFSKEMLDQQSEGWIFWPRVQEWKLGWDAAHSDLQAKSPCGVGGHTMADVEQVDVSDFMKGPYKQSWRCLRCAEIAAAKEVMKYVDHNPDCEFMIDSEQGLDEGVEPRKCSCGFSETLRNFEEAGK